jgi:large subunit ribosomal protein L24
MKSMRIRKGDTVHVLAGKDRGKQGRVLEARPDERRVVVENLNMIKRHTRPKPVKNPSRMGGAQITPGGVIDKAAPIPISNVMLVCPTCNRPTRVGYVSRAPEQKGDDPVKVRVCKRADCGEVIDK